MFGLMLQWFANFGFQNLLQQLENLGFFQYVLPFLLIFAVVYAVLTKIHVFTENKGAAVLIAFAIGLLALQLGIVSSFFQILFPKAAIGIALLLIALILSGAFIPDTKKEYSWVFFGIGMLIFIIVMISAFSDWQFIGSNWWNNYGALIIVLVIVIGAVVGVIVASKRPTTT